MWLTWVDLDGSWALWQAFGVAVTLAASLAQVALLLALVGRRTISVPLAGTLIAIAVVAAMIIFPIVAEPTFSGDYWRVFGVVAILDVLGTVVLTAVGVFGRKPDAGAEPRLLTAAVEARLRDAAYVRETSPSQLVSDALDALLVT